jgi:hypothetical protein
MSLTAAGTAEAWRGVTKEKAVRARQIGVGTLGQLPGVLRGCCGQGCGSVIVWPSLALRANCHASRVTCWWTSYSHTDLYLVPLSSASLHCSHPAIMSAEKLRLTCLVWSIGHSVEVELDNDRSILFLRQLHQEKPTV